MKEIPGSFQRHVSSRSGRQPAPPASWARAVRPRGPSDRAACVLRDPAIIEIWIKMIYIPDIYLFFFFNDKKNKQNKN